MKDNQVYKTLKWVAILLAVFVISVEVYRHFASFGPGEVAYVDANSSFKDGGYKKALELYQQSLKENPNFAPSLRGLANTYVQLKQYDDALAAINKAIAIKPEFGGYYAIRGIIYDHQEQYDKAIADYETAIKADPSVSDGMHWLDRLLYNVQDTPATVADRLKYLKAQMALPPEKRLLKIPEIDERQRPYEQ